MTAAPTVHVIAVGDELRSGRCQDTNGPWMARRLSTLGAMPAQLHVAGDDPANLAGLVRYLAQDARLLVLCGGLGPTGDDTTRQALALAMGRPLYEDPVAWQQVEARLATMGRTSNRLQRTQAFLPEGAEPLENPVGTAPGIRAQMRHATLMALPGVPVEMRAMFEQHVEPFVAAHCGGGGVPARETMWVACMPESDLACRMESLPGASDVALAYYAHHGEIEVVAQAPDPDAVHAFAAQARKELGDAVFDPPEGGRIEHATVRALATHAATVALAESITGGGIAQMLTTVPGSSEVFTFGWVTYSNASKAESLGLSPALIEREGVVSETVARAMAMAARERAGATYGLATTGVAGPGAFQDGSRRVPAGRVHIALATPEGVQARQLDGVRTRDLVRRHACVAALDLLRRAIG